MKKKNIENAVRFYLLATKLKYKIRSGWDNTHWNINSERRESIAEHIYGTCILAISVASESKRNINLDKVIKMLVIHELGEVIIGDITPFDNVSNEEKLEIEHKAVASVIGALIEKDELMSLMLEFDSLKTDEAVFAYFCDKLEADLQAKIYQDMGCQNTLDKQENNVVFNNDKIREMIKNGAKDAFDIWYLYDKNKYKDDEDFAQILEYAKNNNMNI